MTGTFDDWQKTVQLEKEGGVFKKSVELPKTKTQYKVRSLCDSRLPPGAPARRSVPFSSGRQRQLSVQTPANRGA